MNDSRCEASFSWARHAAFALLGGALSAHGQDVAAPVAATSGTPSPYYLGASEGLTHDSNVYRVPFGPGDTYSSTSLLGGFDQRLGRQRLFGKADVSVNRFRDQTQLDNTSYDLSAGLDWDTVHDLSGSLGIGLNRQLAAPGATASLPAPVRNLLQTQNVNALARWGGASLLTLEATLGYDKVDYSAQQYAASDFRQRSAGLAAYYRPRGALRVGVAARVVDTHAPQAFVDTSSGGFRSNSVRSDNLDLLLDYELTGLLTANARASYTRQTNSGLVDAGYSGFTGGLGMTMRPTGKIVLRLDVARDAGFDATGGIATGGALPGSTGSTVGSTGSTGSPPPANTLAAQYQNSRVTDTANLRVTYSATAKIEAFAGARYSRAQLAGTLVDAAGNPAAPASRDVLSASYIGANYAVARNWTLACNLGHEYRHVTGGVAAYAYNDNTVGCSAQYNLHL